MSNWKYTINLSEFYHDDNLTINEKGKRIVEISKYFRIIKDAELENILFLFNDVESIEDFDEIMNYFYDWADINRVWIKTR